MFSMPSQAGENWGERSGEFENRSVKARGFSPGPEFSQTLPRFISL